MIKLSARASNALLAKCRARYGVRLNHQDIQNLISCRKVTDIAAYLKNNTHYAKGLSSVDEGSVHRGQLESALYGMMYDELAQLCGYEISLGEWFGDYIMMRGKIKQILDFLRLLVAGRPGEYIFSLPSFFSQHSDINLQALPQAKSYGEFLSIMKGSCFYSILKSFAPAEGKRIDYSMIEHALFDKLYNTLFSIIDEHFSGKARAELLDLMGSYIDLVNFNHLYRLKRYYSAEPDTVMAMMHNHHYRISKRVLRELITAPDAEAALTVFTEKTPYGRLIDADAVRSGYTVTALNSVIAKKAMRILRFSINPSAVLLAYEQLAEFEIRDIVTIIESVRYSTPPDEIKRLIIIDGYYTV